MTTDATGHAEFVGELAGTLVAGQSVTATATALDGAGSPAAHLGVRDDVAEGCDVTGSAAGET